MKLFLIRAVADLILVSPLIPIVCHCSTINPAVFKYLQPQVDWPCLFPVTPL